LLGSAMIIASKCPQDQPNNNDQNKEKNFSEIHDYSRFF